MRDNTVYPSPDTSKEGTNCYTRVFPAGSTNESAFYSKAERLTKEKP